MNVKAYLQKKKAFFKRKNVSGKNTNDRCGKCSLDGN